MLKELIICALLWIGSGNGDTDLTVTDRATGSEVVEAVVDLIHQSCIFDDDRLLLRRIAYVETQDGTASNTFSNDGATFYGGIWQVNETDFTATLTSASATIYGSIKTVFGIDWKSVQYSSLVKPLYSGLAARLKIDAYFKTSGTTIPQNVNDQALYWAQHYTFNTRGNATVTVDYFVVTSGSIATSCSTPMADIVFVLDGSGSIGASNFANVRTFVNNVVGYFDVSQQKVRIGLIEFSNSATVEFSLTTYSTAEAVQTAVQGIPYFTGGTNSAAGLNSLESLFQSQGRQQDGVPIIAIFMTDGQSNDQTATANAANQLHENMTELTVFSVGVGSSIDVTELQTIASKPSCLYVFTLSSFNDVTSFTNQIMNRACKAQAQLLPAKEIDGSLGYNQYYYFKITVHKLKKGVKIQLKTPTGGCKVYFSWKVRNPSAALYDYTGDSDYTAQDGLGLFIPWNDSVPTAMPSRRRRDTADADVTGTVYGAVVGTQQTQNAFKLTYTDSTTSDPEGNSAAGVKTCSMLMGLLALLLICLQQLSR